jgi:hypothetical protein
VNTVSPSFAIPRVTVFEVPRIEQPNHSRLVKYRDMLDVMAKNLTLSYPHETLKRCLPKHETPTVCAICDDHLELCALSKRHHIILR